MRQKTRQEIKELAKQASWEAIEKHTLKVSHRGTTTDDILTVIVNLYLGRLNIDLAKLKAIGKEVEAAESAMRQVGDLGEKEQLTVKVQNGKIVTEKPQRSVYANPFMGKTASILYYDEPACGYRK